MLAILDLFALRQKALNLTEISSELGYPMSSVLALMKSLSASGYIRLDPATKSYVPTLRVAMLGTWIMGNLFMDGAVIALMDQIQKDTGETVILGARNGLHAQYLHTVQSRRLLRFFVKPGLLRPMSRSAIGQALLMHCSDGEVAAFAARANEASTLERALINPTALVERIREARHRGYAYTDQYTAGICAIGVPVKIGLGRECALAVAGPILRVKRKKDKVAAAIQELSRVYIKASAEYDLDTQLRQAAHVI
ncbi:MAG: IclR family transcriptional regulator [Burkholderiaceae bacterium]